MRQRKKQFDRRSCAMHRASGFRPAERLEYRRLMTAVYSGQGIAETISSASQLDSYTFAATAGGTVELSAGTTYGSLDVGLALIGPGGTTIKMVNSSSTGIVTLSAVAPSSGTYTAVISSDNGATGNYDFSAAALPAIQVTDPLDHAGGNVTSEQAVGGSIGGELDVYSFAVAGGGTVEVSAGTTYGSLDIGLDLFGPTGALLRSINASSNGIVTVSTSATAAGTYYAVVRSDNGAGGNYSMSEASLPEVQDGLTLQSGQGVSGNIGGQLTVYSFGAVAGGEIELSAGTTGGSLNLGLDLVGPNGTILNSVNASSGAAFNLSATAPSTGTYYAVLRSDNGAGGNFNFTAAALGTVQVYDGLDGAGGQIGSGQTESGVLNGQLDTYSFNAIAGGTIELSAGTTYGSLEIGMDLFNPAGVLLKTINANSTGINTFSVPAAATTGTYDVVIRPDNGASGNYTFSAAAVPETQSSPNLQSGQGFSGNIGGQLDVHTFSAVAGGVVEVSAGTTSGSLEIGLDLFGPTGTLLQTVNASSGGAVTLTATAASTGTYYAVIRSDNGAGGNYNFSAAALGTTQVTDPLDHAGGSVESGQPVNGSLGGQLDSYSFAATAGGTIELSAGTTYGGLEIGLDLFNPSGVRIRSVNAIAANIVTLNAPATTTGTYYAVIREDNGAGGNYVFSVGSVPSAQYNGPLTSGQGFAGTISGQLDVHSFQATAGGTIEVSTGTTYGGLNFGLDLFGPGGSLLNSVNASSGGAVTLTTAAPLTGTYYAIVRSDNGAGGNYNFTAAALPAVQDVNDLDNAGGPVASGQAAAGTINGQLDVYDFNAAAGTAIQVSSGVTYGGLHVGLDLFGPAGNLLGTINESSGAAVTINATAGSAGTYYAVVRSDNMNSGNYNFTATYTAAGALPTWVDPSSEATYNAATNVLSVYGPTQIIGDPGSVEPIVAANGSGAQVTISSNPTGIVHLGSVSLTGGAKLSEVSNGSQPLVVVVANGGTFFIDSSSQYDVGGGDLVVSNGSLAGLAAAVGTGYAEGVWTGNGITSSTAADDSRHLTAVGIIPNTVNGHTPIYTSFDADTTAAATDVLIKYTFYGDANLNGKVDGSDYSLTDAGYAADAANPGSATGWYNGNFNYDGTVDGSDYSLIDNGYGNQGLASVPAAIPAELVVPTVKAVIPVNQTAATHRMGEAAFCDIPVSIFGRALRNVGQRAALGSDLPVGASSTENPIAAKVFSTEPIGNESRPDRLPTIHRRRPAARSNEIGTPDGNQFAPTEPS